MGDGRRLCCFDSSDPVEVMLQVSGSVPTSLPPLRLIVPVSPSDSSPQHAADEDEHDEVDAQLPRPAHIPPPSASASQLRPCCMA